MVATSLLRKKVSKSLWHKDVLELENISTKITWLIMLYIMNREIMGFIYWIKVISLINTASNMSYLQFKL